MEILLIQLRVMQMFYHQGHHVCARPSFFSDHEALGSFYSEMDSEYDSVAERMIGLSSSDVLDLKNIISSVNDKLQSIPTNGFKGNNEIFEIGLQLEDELCSLIEHYVSSGISEGTRQLLGDICNRAEMRKYKIKQRIKK